MRSLLWYGPYLESKFRTANLHSNIKYLAVKGEPTESN